MPTAKQLTANRRKALKSTGPRTVAGKSRAALNARRHGLTGQVAHMPAEDRADHDAFCLQFVDTLNPVTPIERELTQSIASGHWRLNRIRAFGDKIVALVDHSHQFGLLTLYLQRTSRQVQRNMRLLNQLQTDRRTSAGTRTNPSLHDEIKGDNPEIGFEFENAEIQGSGTRGARRDLLNHATHPPA